MIDTKHIRIGNIIECKGIMECVTHLKPNLIVFAGNEEKDKKTYARPIDCSGVRLTPSILEIFNYSDIGGVGVFCFDHENKGVSYEYDLEDSLNNGRYSFACNRRILREISYVHELQNIHFILSSKELQYKLIFDVYGF